MLTFIVRLRNVAGHIEIKPTEMCKIMSYLTFQLFIHLIISSNFLLCRTSWFTRMKLYSKLTFMDIYYQNVHYFVFRMNVIDNQYFRINVGGGCLKNLNNVLAVLYDLLCLIITWDNLLNIIFLYF